MARTDEGGRATSVRALHRDRLITIARGEAVLERLELRQIVHDEVGVAGIVDEEVLMVPLPA